MPAPHPLSRDFNGYIEALERKVQELTNALDIVSADLGQLTDRMGAAEKVSGQSPVMLPAKVVGGDNSSVDVVFDGDFAINNYTGEVQEWMESLPTSISGIPNVINGVVAPPPGQALHGVAVGSVPGADIAVLDFFESGVMVTFFPPFVAAPAFAKKVDADFPEGEVYCVVYAKPDLSVECD
mgnify:FL=1|tara:strand:+ start:3984 stop:4529 length:546 start_codon:yes stop_codon:yes gene_type:complete